MADLTGMLQAAAGSAGGGGSTPWELTNATFNGTPFNRFSVRDQTNSGEGVFFRSDGTKMYVIDASNVYEYDLLTAWEVKTASYVQAFSVSTEEGAPRDLFFKPDGTKMYIVGVFGDEVNEYSLSTAWDISTASYVQNFSVAAQETDPTGLFFKPDGTKMYIAGDNGNDINEYSLSTAWNISTASYVQNFSVGAQEAGPSSLSFKDDGTKMYVLGRGGVDVNEYSLSTAWNISTASYVQVFSVASQETGPNGMFFKDDGTKMYVIGTGSNFVHSYDLSSAWDISTASYSFPPTTEYFSVANEEIDPRGIFFKPDGAKMYVIGRTGDDVNEYDLSTAWDITSASYLQVFSVAGQETSPQNLFFKPDGTKMYVTGSSGDDVNEYNLSTAWNVSTASYVQAFSVVSQDSFPTAVFFKPDGTKMYVVGLNNAIVIEYSLSTAWNVSTASFVQSFSVVTQDSLPHGLFFKDDGTKMYVSGLTNISLYEYDLATAWDISTASYVQSFFVGSQASSARGIFFKDDGTKIYLVGSASDAIWSFDL